MNPHLLPRRVVLPRRLVLGSLALGVAGACLCVALPSSWAQSKSCALVGEPVMPAELRLYATATGGDAIARFTGTKSTLTVSEAPTKGSSRVKVRTGSGTGNVAIEGYVEAAELPVSTRVMLPVVPAHVWIAAGTRVALLDAAPGRMRVEARLQQPIAQAFSTWTACDTLTLAPVPRDPSIVSGEARGYLMNKPRLELFDTPTADRHVVWTVERSSSGPGVLFWSEESRNGFVRVTFHGEVILQGWARTSELRALPPGETLDMLPPPPIVSTTQIKVPPRPKVVRFTKPALVRANPSGTAAILGVAEPQAEVYILDIVAGWASILPTAGHVVPPPERQFWVEKPQLDL